MVFFLFLFYVGFEHYDTEYKSLYFVVHSLEYLELYNITCNREVEKEYIYNVLYGISMLLRIEMEKSSVFKTVSHFLHPIQTTSPPNRATALQLEMWTFTQGKMEQGTFVFRTTGVKILKVKKTFKDLYHMAVLLQTQDKRKTE